MYGIRVGDTPSQKTPEDTAIVRTSHGPRSVFKPDRGLTNADGWANVLTGLGQSSRDKRLGTDFIRDYEIDRDTLESMFHGDDLVRRVCELPAKEAIREWIEIPGDKDRKIQKKLTTLNARGKIFEALTWARLYGGCIIVMIVKDGRTIDQPLAIEAAQDVVDLMVIDRHDLWVSKFYSDPSQANFGAPELYTIRTSAVVAPTGNSGERAGFGQQIHESRVLRFDGSLTGRRRRRDNQGWALSVMDSVFDVVRDFSSAFGGMAHLLQDYSQGVFKIKGLAAALASDQDNLVLKRLQMMDIARSIARAIPLDADGEDFKRETTQTAGLPDLLDRMAQRLSQATDIPVTLLMGTSAAGLNATGEGDLTNWYNNVRTFQELSLRHPVHTLLRVIAIVEGVKFKEDEDAPDDDRKSSEEVEFSWRPLWQPTEQETAQTRLTVAQTDRQYFDMGALDASEIAVSRFGGEKYSMETSIDLKEHEQKQGDPPAKDEPLDPDADPEADPADPKAAKTSGNKGAGSDVQATALNGAQVTALQGMLTAVAEGALAPEAAKIAIRLSFPAFDPNDITSMVSAIEVKEPEPPPPALAPFAGQAPNPGPEAPPNAPPKPAQTVPKAPPKPAE